MTARWLTAIAVLAGAGTAHAYPHLQRTTGTDRCSRCHVAPAGGGLLTAWGQDEDGDTISRGGDGRFLHGAIALPDWLQIGGDLRLAALANDVGDTSGTELAAFPMQADVATRVGAGAWSVVAVVGARGAVRSGAPTSVASPATMVAEPSLASYVISREHYVMWRPDPDAGVYVRAGRFAAPYGLRLVDHSAYVRRYFGYNLMEETYGLGVGYLAGAVEVHATALVYDPLQGAVRKEVGGALLVEAQPGDAFVIGASARAGRTSEDTRAQAGIHAKLWLPGARLLVHAELDGARQMFAGGAGDRWQLAGYAGPVVVVARGVYAGLAYEAFSEDLQVRGVARQAVDAWLSVLPRAHFEVMVSARAQRVGPSEHAYAGLLQLHYNL